MLVEPVQILENYYERLVEALPQNDAFDRLERPPLFDLSIHLLERIVALYDTQQREQIRQRILQIPIQCEHAAGDLFAPPALIVRARDIEVVAQQLDYRKIGRRLAV